MAKVDGVALAVDLTLPIERIAETLTRIIRNVPVLIAVCRDVILHFAPKEAPRFGISGLGPEVVRYSMRMP
ncbi:MAG: hypothetical protein Q7T82_16475, partial [Armatimonadota bacterium]|nr:hypothetical protein [Armatimonadota bacterium]